jgi:hypothetical protein
MPGTDLRSGRGVTAASAVGTGPRRRAWRWRLGRLAAGLVLVAGGWPEPAGAGEERFSWRGRPQPRCTISLITETGPRVGTDEWDSEPFGYAIAVGWTRNAPPRELAWGGAAQITTSQEGGTYLVTLMPRARCWLGSGVALDAGAGLALLGPGESPIGLKGAAASAGLNFGDLVSLTGGLDYEFPRDGHPARTSVSLGLRFDSYLGPPALLATLALAVAFVAGEE